MMLKHHFFHLVLGIPPLCVSCFFVLQKAAAVVLVCWSLSSSSLALTILTVPSFSPLSPLLYFPSPISPLSALNVLCSCDGAGSQMGGGAWAGAFPLLLPRPLQPISPPSSALPYTFVSVAPLRTCRALISISPHHVFIRLHFRLHHGPSAPSVFPLLNDPSSSSRVHHCHSWSQAYQRDLRRPSLRQAQLQLGSV